MKGLGATSQNSVQAVCELIDLVDSLVIERCRIARLGSRRTNSAAGSASIATVLGLVEHQCGVP